MFSVRIPFPKFDTGGTGGRGVGSWRRNSKNKESRCYYCEQLSTVHGRMGSLISRREWLAKNWRRWGELIEVSSLVRVSPALVQPACKGRRCCFGGGVVVQGTRRQSSVPLGMAINASPGEDGGAEQSALSD